MGCKQSTYEFPPTKVNNIKPVDNLQAVIHKEIYIPCGYVQNVTVYKRSDPFFMQLLRGTDGYLEVVSSNIFVNFFSRTVHTVQKVFKAFENTVPLNSSASMTRIQGFLLDKEQMKKIQKGQYQKFYIVFVACRTNLVQKFQVRCDILLVD